MENVLVNFRFPAGWLELLPVEVRDLIGVAGEAVVDDREARRAYHDYLAEKHA